MKPEHGGDAPRSGGSGGLMMTRREACAATGLSVGALSLVGTDAVARTPQDTIRYVVTDQRYLQTLAFGAVLQKSGAQRLEVGEGLTRLWSDALMGLWGQNKSGAVAGLTLTETWSGLAEQARSAGRRSILVGHHLMADSDVVVSHSLALTRSVPGMVPALERCGLAWPSAMAEFATTFGVGAGCRPTFLHRPEQPTGAPVALALTSWIIA